MSLRPPADFHAAPDVYGFRTIMVNYFFVRVSRGDWVLVDAGLPFSGARLMREAAIRFGSGRPPRAIVLTHGHFDHVGSLRRLQRDWPGVPVYAHPAELPFLTVRRPYARPNLLAGGGVMPLTAILYPRRMGPYANVFALPADGSVPALPEWHWLPTPGHTPGHISLFRPRDRLLLAGDAVITTRQESAYSILRQTREVRPPPAYFTPDWQAAYDSLLRIRSIGPARIAAGHGVPVGGAFLTDGLDRLARDFPVRLPATRTRRVPDLAPADTFAGAASPAI